MRDRTLAEAVYRIDKSRRNVALRADRAEYAYIWRMRVTGLAPRN